MRHDDFNLKHPPLPGPETYGDEMDFLYILGVIGLSVGALVAVMLFACFLFWLLAAPKETPEYTATTKNVGYPRMENNPFGGRVYTKIGDYQYDQARLREAQTKFKKTTAETAPDAYRIDPTTGESMPIYFEEK